MEKASESNQLSAPLPSASASLDARYPDSAVKKWWAGDIVCAFTDTVVSDLRDTYHIHLDPVYHKQVISFQVTVVAPSKTDATMTVWSAEESMLQTKGLVPSSSANDHVTISMRQQRIVAWRLLSPTTSPTHAAFERFRHFLFEYQLAAVLRDDPGCRVYLVHSCEQLAPTPPDSILAISILTS